MQSRYDIAIENGELSVVERIVAIKRMFRPNVKRILAWIAR